MSENILAGVRTSNLGCLYVVAVPFAFSVTYKNCSSACMCVKNILGAIFTKRIAKRKGLAKFLMQRQRYGIVKNGELKKAFFLEIVYNPLNNSGAFPLCLFTYFPSVVVPSCRSAVGTSHGTVRLIPILSAIVTADGIK